jgi:hypothetical protein
MQALLLLPGVLQARQADARSKLADVIIIIMLPIKP